MNLIDYIHILDYYRYFVAVLILIPKVTEIYFAYSDQGH